MKILNFDITEQITLKAGAEIIMLQPLRKSGRKVCIGITANRSVEISDPEKIVEAGLEQYT